MAVVVTALAVAAVLVVALAAVGLLRLPLEGVPLEGNGWVVDLTEATQLHALGYDGSGVTICLVDTGIDLIHPDLARADVVGWKDFVNGEPGPYDDGGHGTAMAGLIVANGKLRGIAPGASLLVVKGLDKEGTGSSVTLGSAIRFCMDPDRDGNPRDAADIISLSLGAQRTPFTTNAVEIAAREALAQGIFVVSSAGNDGRDDDGDVGTPANEPLVFAIGSVDADLQLADFSSRGYNDASVLPERVDPNRKPEFVLPGVALVSTASSSSYTATSGTSASAALFSGLLALLLEAHPGYAHGDESTILTLKDRLMGNALPLPDQVTPHDDRYGYGLPLAWETSRPLN